MTEHGLVSIGIAAAVGPETGAVLAAAVEDAGLHALWVNDSPGADALAVVEAAARATTRLTLATGVLPVDRRSPTEIAARAAALPQDRLVLGIGSGAMTTGALRRMTDAAAQLRDLVSARIVVGALGPKMRRLAAEESDGVLLTWLTPDAAHEQSAQARAAASDVHVALYVRAAFDPAALPRLEAEMRRYAGIASYAANFARQRAEAADTVLSGVGGATPGRLAAYRTAADEVVLRAITPTDGVDDLLRFVEEAGELLQEG